MERITITARIGGAAVIMQSLALCTPFDSLLAWAAIDAKELELGRQLEQKEADGIIESLPLRKIPFGDGSFLYAASIPSFNGVSVPYAKDVIIRKQMNLQRMIDRTDDETLAKFGQSSGPWKTSTPTYTPIMTEAITWVVDGEIVTVREMVKGITHIGKKRSIGYGRLLEPLRCEPAVPGTPLKRFLPVEFFPSVEAQLAIPVMPPYWKIETKLICGPGEIPQAEGEKS